MCFRFLTRVLQEEPNFATCAFDSLTRALQEEPNIPIFSRYKIHLFQTLNTTLRLLRVHTFVTGKNLNPHMSNVVPTQLRRDQRKCCSNPESHQTNFGESAS